MSSSRLGPADFLRVTLPADPPPYVLTLMDALGYHVDEDPALPRPIPWRVHDGEDERTAWAGYHRDLLGVESPGRESADPRSATRCDRPEGDGVDSPLIR